MVCSEIFFGLCIICAPFAARGRSSYSPLGSVTNIPAQAKQEKDKDAGHEHFILLADTDLMELPLEALTSLRADAISGLSRDFSLQLLYHRVHQGISPGGCCELGVL